jgi:putative membrane protein
MMWWSQEYWPMPWFGPLVMIAFIVLFGAMMFFMMRGMMSGHGSRSREPLDILQERFARGEISRTEYEEGKRVLGV